MRILVKYPTRGRPERAAQTLAALRTTLSGRHEVRFIVVVDEDDPAYADQVPCFAAAGLVESSPGIAGVQRGTVIVRQRPLGCAPGKVAACNAFTPPPESFDVLVMLSDDLIPAPGSFGWDERIALDMERAFPNLDGCLWYLDGYQARLCTAPVIGREWFRKMDPGGRVYPGCYRSEWCDNEIHEVAARRGRMHFTGRELFRHEHWSNTAAVKVDATYARASIDAEGDPALYRAREAAGFGWPEVLLSICICSLHWRRETLGELLANLNAQIAGMSAVASGAGPASGSRPEAASSPAALEPVQITLSPRMVEIVLEIDDGEASIGIKRGRCLKRAIGRYVMFIDDDDRVAPDMVERLLGALLKSPAEHSGAEADCAALRGVMLTDGTGPEPFEHTIAHAAWASIEDAQGRVRHLRSPNHWNAVRIDHARAAGFPDRSWGEDYEYSKRMIGKLKNEAGLGPRPIYGYRRRMIGESLSARLSAGRTG